MRGMKKILITIALSFLVSSQALATTDCTWTKSEIKRTQTQIGDQIVVSESKVCPTETELCSSCNGARPTDFLCCKTIAKKVVSDTKAVRKIPDYIFQIPIGELSSLKTVDCSSGTCAVPFLAQYIQAVYKYGLSIAGVVGVLMLMAAGLLYLVSGGDSGKITQAKKMIFGSIFGLTILVGLTTFLSFINPNLIIVRSISLDSISRIEIGNEVPEGGTTPLFTCLYKEYGNSAAEVSKNLTTVNFLGKNYQVHNKMAVALKSAQQQVTAAGILYKSTESGGGAFNWRANVNKPTEQSLHSFGIALDINPTKNPNYQSTVRPCKTDMPISLINIMRNNGFRWGGDYKTVCDSMHFEWVKGSAPCTIK